MPDNRKLRIGFVSTRFSTTDGVSLETAKWTLVLERLGHECFYFAGLCDWPTERSYVVPEAHFKHPDILSIYEPSFTRSIRPPAITERIYQIKDFLKSHLREFVRKFDIDLLLVENALAIPLHVPLGVAITELIAETGLPTIAHHHDFYWERKRFLTNCIWDFIAMAFPPRLPSMSHVVINSVAASQLSLRTGRVATVIPNVMDYDVPPQNPDAYAATLRDDLQVASDEYLILQPTRIVRRKGIERAIELVRLLDLKARLIISHASGDEGTEYEAYIRKYAKLLGVQSNFVSDIIQDRRAVASDGRKIYSLWDVYPQANLVTYPSYTEGFGNAFLEAVYFRRPILVNNYTIYAIDIKPKGFEAVEFDGFITDATVARVRQLLTTPALVEEMAQHNYELAKRYYSFKTLEYHLRALLHAAFGSG